MSEEKGERWKISVEILEEHKEGAGEEGGMKSETLRHFLLPLQFLGMKQGLGRSKLVPKHRMIWSRWCHACELIIIHGTVLLDIYRDNDSTNLRSILLYQYITFIFVLQNGFISHSCVNNEIWIYHFKKNSQFEKRKEKVIFLYSRLQ